MTETPDGYLAAQQAEWGQWVANQPIYFNGARAFNTDDPVPASHVTRYGYERDGLVRPAGTDAPATETAQATPAQGDDIVITPDAATAPFTADEHGVGVGVHRLLAGRMDQPRRDP